MQAFIFDFDGVIVDSERHWPAINRKLFRQWIPEWKEEHSLEIKGLSAGGMHEHLQSKYGLSLPFSTFLDHLQNIVPQVYSEESQLLPGLEALLHRLDAAHIPCGIASSSQSAWLDIALRRFDLKHRFKVVATGDMVPGRAKPFPDVYLLAAKQLNIVPTECIAIEDSDNGIAAAQAAGMRCIAFHSDMNEGQPLPKADHHVHHLDEVTIELLQSMEHTNAPRP